MDASGDLFGITQKGGADGAGTVYEIVKLSGTPIATTTTILSSPNPVAAGNGVSITATVTSSTTPFPFPPLSGAVTFSSLSRTLGSGAIRCGNQTTSIGISDPESIAGIGTFPITAQFTPDIPNFAPSTATTSETVTESGIVVTSGNNTLTGNQTINGNESVNGSISATSLTIGGGAPIGQYDSATFTIAIPSLAPGSCTTQTRIWSAVGSGTIDTIALGVPDSFLSAGGALFFQAWESAANTIKFRACNVDAHGPPSSSVTGSIRVDLIKH